MELKVIRCSEEFRDSKEEWNSITSKMKDATPFQTWEWNYCWWTNHSDDTELFIIKAYENKTTFGFAPLVIKGNTIEFIGENHFDYGLFIISERTAVIFSLFIDEVIQYAKQHKKNVVLKNVPVSSSQYVLFRNFRKKRKNYYLRECVDTASIDIKAYNEFEGYVSAIGKSLRKKRIRPCIIPQNRFCEVEFSDEIWMSIENIYQDRMEERVGISDLSWAKETIRQLATLGLIRIFVLRTDGQASAFYILFDYKQTYYGWLTAFKKVEKYELGHFMRYKVVEKAFEEKRNRMDLMRGAYDYKMEWDCNLSSNWEFMYFTYRYQKYCFIMYMRLRRIIRDFVYNHKKIKNFYRKRLSKI